MTASAAVTTILELKLLNHLVTFVEEPGEFSTIDLGDCAFSLDIPAFRLRGTLSSLCKKGFVMTEEYDVNGKDYLFLHPTPAGLAEIERLERKLAEIRA